MHRVLRDNEIVYAQTPFLQQVHAGPFDFTPYAISGHRYLFGSFEEISAGPVAGPGTQLGWSLGHVVRASMRSELAGELARVGSLGCAISTAWFRLPLRWTARLRTTSWPCAGPRDLTPDEIIEYDYGAEDL
jgi:hypothetical protein